MATKKIEIRPKGTGDYADVLYPKTSSDMVIDEATGQTVATRLANAVKKSELIYNVMDYGAKGDGTTDDWQAFTNAIAATPVGGTLFIPTPSSKYKMSATLNINKPIRILGTNRVYDVDGNLEKVNVLEFVAGVVNGLNITSYDVLVENIVVKMLDATNSLIAGININGSSMRFMRFTNVFVHLPAQYGKGFKGQNFVLATFEKCIAYQGAYGFYFDTAVNNVKFDNCWARHSYITGYYMSNASYCSFITTACDSLNNPDYAYQIINSQNVTFVAVGGELTGKTMFYINNSDGISVNGFAYNMNRAGTAVATFALLENGSKNVVFNGCVDSTSGSSVPNVKRDGFSSHPTFISCDFPIGYSDNGVTINPPGIKDGVFFPLQMDINFLPAPSSAHEGKLLITRGGASSADVLQICLKSATGTYSWKTIATG